MEVTTPHIGPKLKSLREKAGLKQDKVAKALGYTSIQLISNWERNLAMFPVKSVPQLSRLYSVSQDTLIDYLVQNYKAKTQAKVAKKVSKKLSSRAKNN